MDIRFFLDQRLAFVRQLYINCATPFVERKRMIEAGKYPYVPPYSEDGEPPFLAEWLEAEESLQVLGHACVSMLSASFLLYLRAYVRQLNVPVGDKYKSDFKRGWFNGYKAYFLGEFSVAFEDSLCNLGLLEELVLARNRAQHPDSITSQSAHYSESDLKKIRNPFFIDDRDFELFSEQEEGERSWLMPPTIHITPEKFLTAAKEVSLFVDWFEKP